MATLYYMTSNDKPANDAVYTGGGGAGLTYALAGDCPGVPGANWIESSDLNLGKGWAVQHGAAVWLSKGSWGDFKGAYRSPLATKAA